MHISSAKITVNTMSTASSAFAVDATSIAAGLSNTIVKDEIRMKLMMRYSNCLSSTTLWQNTRTGLVGANTPSDFVVNS